MKIISQKYVQMCFAVVLLSAIYAASGYAHDMWINMQDYTLDKSKPAVLTVGYGHSFVIPGKEFLSRDQVDKVFFIGPDGKEIFSTPAENEKYLSNNPLQTEGSYVAVVKQRGGFFSKTTEGYKQGKSKKDLKDVIECRYSEKYAKALFAVGAPGGDAFSQVLGHQMEIVPLKDPAKLKEGDEFPVKVLFQGKPVRTYVYGTYAEFSNESNTFAYTTYTDKDGIAKIKVIKAGTWLLIVKQEMAYPDVMVCDKMSYAASLTFKVR
jgi:uncharacterized GH25 family protein